MDTSSNTRTDEWGGSVENRCRFGLETMKALIDVFGPGRVGIKLSPAGGYDDVGVRVLLCAKVDLGTDVATYP